MGSSATKPNMEQPKSKKRSLAPADCLQDDRKKSKIEVAPLRLTDLNKDCLEHIFELLNLQDLVNIAETDDQFVPAAISVYSRYHRSKKKVYVNLSPISYGQTDCVDVEQNFDSFFRHFGHLTSHLLVNALGSNDIKIEASLQKYCLISLIHLDLAFCGETDFERIDEPFLRVTELTVIESQLGAKMSQLNVWFPCLNRLELVYTTLSQTDHLEVNFPNLTHLEIYTQELDLPASTMRELFRLNPQLKTLLLLYDYDVEFLQFMNQCLPQLEVLELWTPKNRFLTFGDEKVHFKKVKKFTLNASSHRGDFVVNVPFQFTCLDELSLDGFNQFKDHLLPFIRSCTDISKLNLVPFIEDWDDLTFDDLTNVIAMMPNLVELEFCADTFAKNDVVELLSNSKNLQQVYLLFIELPSTQFYDAIEKDWVVNQNVVETSCPNVYMDYYCFALKRKNQPDLLNQI